MQSAALDVIGVSLVDELHRLCGNDLKVGVAAALVTVGKSCRDSREGATACCCCVSFSRIRKAAALSSTSSNAVSEVCR